MIIIDLIFNLAVLVSVSVVSGFIGNRYKPETMTGMILQGLLFGIVALVGMLNPFVLAPGLIFDGRSVVLSLCGLYFGPVAGFISAIIALAYRIYLGGSGVYMGISVITTSTLIGIFFFYRHKNKKIVIRRLSLYGISMIVHVTMLLLIFAIPSPMRRITFNTLAITILGVYPLASVLIGSIIKDHFDSRGFRDAQTALLESENKFALFMDHLPAFAFIKDSTFKSIFTNKKMNETLGASQWIGLTPPEFFPGEFGNKLLSEDQIAMETGMVKVETQTTDIQGVMHYYETQKFIIPRDGKPPLLGGISIDITDRKKAEDELREKALELKRFNSMMVGRELKMVELKKEINALLISMGRPEKYVIQ